MITKTRLVLTSPFGVSKTLKSYEGVRITESEDNPVKTASIEASFLDNRDIMAYQSINSRLDIYSKTEDEQNERLLFSGFISSVPKVLDGNIKKYSFEAQDYIGKTKTILINEVFDNMNSSTIVGYLLNNYTDFFDQLDISIPSQRISLEFKDEYLYDCLNKIAEITGTNFEAKIRTFSMRTRNDRHNIKTIRRNMFEKGSANFTDDSTQMVNHIRLYGGRELTPEHRVELFNPNGTIKQFYTTYQPSEVRVFRDDSQMRVGTMYLHDDNGRYDAFVDYNNSLIEFVNPPPRGQQVRIEYRYYQRIVVEETDQQSIEQFGYFMKTERVEHITDRVTLRSLAREKIRNDREPKKVGSLKVFRNDWNTKETVDVLIPEIGINERMTITQKDITISPGKMDIGLSFERKPDLSTILKNHLNRIRELERGRSEVESIDKYRTIEEKIELNEIITVKRLDRENTFKIGLSLIGEAL